MASYTETTADYSVGTVGMELVTNKRGTGSSSTTATLGIDSPLPN